MKIFEKCQLFNRVTGKPDGFQYIHRGLYACDYCAKVFTEEDQSIYSWLTPHESGDIEQAWSMLDDIEGFPSPAIWEIYGNNEDFHFCDDEGESVCQYKMMKEYLKSENKYYGICRMLYEARRVAISHLVKTYSVEELIGEES